MSPAVQLNIAQPTAIGEKPSTDFGMQRTRPQDQDFALVCPCFKLFHVTYRPQSH